MLVCSAMLTAGCGLLSREARCPTDARRLYLGVGEEAVRACPCGPDAAFHGLKPTHWRRWSPEWALRREDAGACETASALMMRGAPCLPTQGQGGFEPWRIAPGPFGRSPTPVMLPAPAEPASPPSGPLPSPPAGDAVGPPSAASKPGSTTVAAQPVSRPIPAGAEETTELNEPTEPIATRFHEPVEAVVEVEAVADTAPPRPPTSQRSSATDLVIEAPGPDTSAGTPRSPILWLEPDPAPAAAPASTRDETPRLADIEVGGRDRDAAAEPPAEVLSLVIDVPDRPLGGGSGMTVRLRESAEGTNDNAHADTDVLAGPPVDAKVEAEAGLAEPAAVEAWRATGSCGDEPGNRVAPADAPEAVVNEASSPAEVVSPAGALSGELFSVEASDRKSNAPTSIRIVDQPAAAPVMVLAPEADPAERQAVPLDVGAVVEPLPRQTSSDSRLILPKAAAAETGVRPPRPAVQQAVIRQVAAPPATSQAPSQLPPRATVEDRPQPAPGGATSIKVFRLTTAEEDARASTGPGPRVLRLFQLKELPVSGENNQSETRRDPR